MEFEMGNYRRLSGGYEPTDAQGRPRTGSAPAKPWDRGGQTRSLLLKGTYRWIVTVIFTGLIVLTLKIYEKKGNFPSSQKKTFDAIMTGLILFRGLNLFEACKESARVVRWKFLAQSPHTQPEVDLILGIENLLIVLELGYKSFKKPRRAFWCMLWSLQVLVALVSLTYEVKSGTNYGDIYTRSGLVNTANLSTYINRENSSIHSLNQALAHTYGEVTRSAQDCEPYEDIMQVYKSANNPPYFCRRTPGKQEFTYRFKEYNKNDVERVYPYFTDRLVTASSGPCFKYKVLENPTLVQDLNGYLSAANWTFANSTYISSITIPMSSEGASATVYVYRGPDLPQLTKVNACGNRCLWIWAHQTALLGQTDSSVFQCPITISEVSNAMSGMHSISDSVARVAAASIALQGRWESNGTQAIWTQFQFHAIDTPWETHFKPDERVGANMAEFALRSLATMAELNPSVQVPGHVPYLGSHVDVYNHWINLIAVLLITVGLHLILVLVSVWMTRSVVVTDDSSTAIARLLDDTKRPTQREGQANEKPLYESGGIAYGPLRTLNGNYILRIREDVTPLNRWKGRRHPNGNYISSTPTAAYPNTLMAMIRCWCGTCLTR